MEKLNKVLIKHSDEIVANNTDKTFEELELQTAERNSGRYLEQVKDNVRLSIVFQVAAQFIQIFWRLWRPSANKS